MSLLIKRYSTLILVLILSFAFFTRVYRLNEPDAYVFDEVYHAVTAKLIARNDPRAYEWWNPAPEPNTAVDWLHPPLAKYTQALGILAFGENSFGWRISSAIFGLLVIAMTYSLTKEVFDSEGTALLAAGLASLDGLLLTQSRVAMNDIHVTFFILLTLTCYLKFRKLDQLRWLWFTGISAGLAVSSKWSGVFVIGIVGMFEGWHLVQALLTQRSKLKLSTFLRTTLKVLIIRLLVLIVIPASIYVLSYSHMFYQGKSLVCLKDEPIQGECYYDVSKRQDGTPVERYISHFQELHKQIWWYQTHLEATHDYQSRPWQWFLNLRPVWFHVQYVNDTRIANIYALSNPALAWLGGSAVMITLFFLAYRLGNQVSSLNKTRFQVGSLPAFVNPLLFILVSYLAVWLPWQLSPRIMFFYHYTPAIPLLCILLAYWLTQLWNLHHPPQKVTKTVRSSVVNATKKSAVSTSMPKWHQVLVLVILIVMGATFIVWYPQWTGIPVTRDFADTVYFALKSWK
jgi:dolichyl-phosphate-mannose-protein mannosyltransferase